MAKITLSFLMFIVLTSCNSQTMKDIYEKENLPLEIEGNVEKVIIYKGGNTSLNIQTNKGNNQEIAVASDMREIIRQGDYFIKEKNSNKCKIIRNDSVIYLDCYNIPKEIRDSLGLIKEWPNYKKGHWQKR